MGDLTCINVCSILGFQKNESCPTANQTCPLNNTDCCSPVASDGTLELGVWIERVIPFGVLPHLCSYVPLKPPFRSRKGVSPIKSTTEHPIGDSSNALETQSSKTPKAPPILTTQGRAREVFRGWSICSRMMGYLEWNESDAVNINRLELLGCLGGVLHLGSPISMAPRTRVISNTRTLVVDVDKYYSKI